MADSWPLTTAQYGIWVGQQLDPASPAYNTAEYADIEGPLARTAEAYEHTLVTGNDGCIEVSDFAHDLDDAVAYARHVAYEVPLARLKNEQARAADDNARLQREVEALQTRLKDAEGTSAEAVSLREERDLIRARVTEMLQQLDGLNL